jgi:hypothetical protein
MKSMRARVFALLLVAGLAPAAAAADAAGGKKKEQAAAPAAASPYHAVFGSERASQDARSVADWVVVSADNENLPFAILDKKDAKVFVFHPDGRLRGAAPALLGVGRGDVALPGIGARELSNIAPNDRVTQAGRFVVDLGLDHHGDDVLWLDYEGGLAMHRVITSNVKERRAHRLATPSPLDNRISYGCINLPVKFYEQVVQPAFTGTKGIVYVLPETRQAREFFASGEAPNTLARPMVVVDRPATKSGATGN